MWTLDIAFTMYSTAFLLVVFCCWTLLCPISHVFYQMLTPWHWNRIRIIDTFNGNPPVTCEFPSQRAKWYEYFSLHLLVAWTSYWKTVADIYLIIYMIANFFQLVSPQITLFKICTCPAKFRDVLLNLAKFSKWQKITLLPENAFGSNLL